MGTMTWVWVQGTGSSPARQEVQVQSSVSGITSTGMGKGTTSLLS